MNALYNEHLTLHAIKAAVKAGELVLKIYNSEYSTTFKEDKSPLTTADISAHNSIADDLVDTDFPLLSEEGRNIPWDLRRKWHYFWLVDPLDGTKEFINRNGEFTVNIALIAGQIPVIGVIYVPVSGMLYFGNQEIGSWSFNCSENNFDSETTSLPAFLKICNKLPIIHNTETITVLASRSHLSTETKEFTERLKEKYPECEIVNAGSSLKFCRLAEGVAQYYPRFSPTMEWDTAAGHAIASFAGVEVKAWPGNLPLIYNKENLVNPWFIALREGLPHLAPEDFIR